MRILFVLIACGILLSMGCIEDALVSKCPDGTLEKACSENRPLYCAGGELIKSTEKCGCKSGQVLLDGDCVDACPDGTMYGECSKSRPKMCVNGTLEPNPAKCGCEDSRYDIIDNACVIKRCLDGTGLGGCSASNISFFCSKNGTLESNPSSCGCPQGFGLYNGNCWKNCNDGTVGGKCSKDGNFCMNGSLVMDTDKCTCPLGQVRCGDSCIAPRCTDGSDCDDDNDFTQDSCIGSGMCNATCSNEYYTSVIYDKDDTPRMHDLEFSIDTFDEIGRELLYSLENGTERTHTLSSSKAFVEVYVTIEAHDDYKYDVSQSTFYLIDDEDKEYSPICFTKSNKTTSSYSSCYNEGAFDEYDRLDDGDTVNGYLYFEIPRSNDPKYLAFEFGGSLKPEEIWFRYD